MSKEHHSEVEEIQDENEIENVQLDAPQTETSDYKTPMQHGSPIDNIKSLITNGANQRLLIRRHAGDPIVDVALPLGFAMAGALILIAPFLAILIALGIVLTKTTINIVESR